MRKSFTSPQLLTGISRLSSTLELLVDFHHKEKNIHLNACEFHQVSKSHALNATCSSTLEETRVPQHGTGKSLMTNSSLMDWAEVLDGLLAHGVISSAT